MGSLPEQPQMGEAQGSTMEHPVDTTAHGGDLDMGDVGNIDWDQWMTFDSDSSAHDQPNANQFLQNDQISHTAPANIDANANDGDLLAGMASSRETNALNIAGLDGREPTTAQYTAEHPITSAPGTAVGDAASIMMATAADCTIMPDNLVSQNQPPPFGNASLVSGPTTPVSWDFTANVQPYGNTFRPSSAPLMGTCGPNVQFPSESQYDQSLEQAWGDYPPPPNNMDYNGSTCYYTNAGIPVGVSNPGTVPMESYQYQQISLSYPGSPTQPIEPAVLMNGFVGPPGMPHEVRRYYRPASSKPPVPAAMFNDGPNNMFIANMQQPPTSNPRKRAVPPGGAEGRDPTRQRVQDWLVDDNATTRVSQTVQPLDMLLQPWEGAPKSASSVSASIASAASDVDITKAVTLPTRRNRNPGRKITIPQTAAVTLRNRIRRERYREKLPPQKRKVYDFNASVAKGLIKVFDDDEAEVDAVHDAV